MALRERVYSILVEANGGDERMTSLGASECLYNAGLGLRYVQVRDLVGCRLLLRQRRAMCVKGCESAAMLVRLLLVLYFRLRASSNQVLREASLTLLHDRCSVCSSCGKPRKQRLSVVRTAGPVLLSGRKKNNVLCIFIFIFFVLMILEVKKLISVCLGIVQET